MLFVQLAMAAVQKIKAAFKHVIVAMEVVK
jgi:hypothetical protein